MKFLNYVKTLFIPRLMGKRKNINVFISFLILLLISYLIAIPYIQAFKKNAYDVFCDSSSYTFNIFDSEKSSEIEFSGEEKETLGDRYIYSSVSDLKNIGFKIKNSQVIIPSNIDSIENLEYNKKEYLLKREVFEYDNSGNRTGESQIYYIHIVFDMYENSSSSFYDVKKKFDTLYTEDEFNHYLLVFYSSCFKYRNKYMIDHNKTSYSMDYNDVEIDFSEMTDLDYITHKITNVLIPEMRMQYTFNTFIYAVLGPIFIALLAFVFTRNKHILISYKHYYNVAAICSIPVSIIFFILEWIPFFIKIGILELYIVFLAIYYFTVITVINRNIEIE